MKFDRNKIIDIKQETTSKDTYGQPLDTYITVKANIWASIQPTSGRDFFLGQQTNSEVSYKVITEYMTGVLPKMVVFYDTRKLEIISVINYKEQNRELTLMCKELI